MGRTRASDKVASAMKTGGDDDVADGEPKYQKLGVKALRALAKERGIVLAKDKRRVSVLAMLVVDDYGTYHITGVV